MLNAQLSNAARAGGIVALLAVVLLGAAPVQGQILKDRRGLPVDMDHILEGNINSRGELVGLHHRPSAPRTMEFDGVDCRVEFVTTSAGTDADVRQARVSLKHPKTGRVVREKFSTLFPDAWSAGEIQRAIQEAYRDADKRGRVEDNGRWSGQTARGVRIDGYLTRDGRRIATAFPVYSPPRQTRSRR